MGRDGMGWDGMEAGSIGLPIRLVDMHRRSREAPPYKEALVESVPIGHRLRLHLPQPITHILPEHRLCPPAIRRVTVLHAPPHLSQVDSIQRSLILEARRILLPQRPSLVGHRIEHAAHGGGSRKKSLYKFRKQVPRASTPPHHRRTAAAPPPHLAPQPVPLLHVAHLLS